VQRVHWKCIAEKGVSFLFEPGKSLNFRIGIFDGLVKQCYFENWFEGNPGAQVTINVISGILANQCFGICGTIMQFCIDLEL
jgi:hypothetical protein